MSSSFRLLDPALVAHLVTAQRLEERRGYRSTGIEVLDGLLGGGWPQAAVSELAGPCSSGRTGILYASLARAIDAAETAALIDVAGALDPRSAIACGVTLSRLLWIRCAPDLALKAVDLVLGAGGFDVIALDFGNMRPRVPTPGWIRLKHGAERQGTAVLIAAPTRTVGAFAAAAVELSAGTPRFLSSGAPLFAGVCAEVTRERCRHAASIDEEKARCASLVFTCRN